MPNILSIETSSACCSVCIITDHLETQLYDNNAPNTHGDIIFEFSLSVLIPIILKYVATSTDIIIKLINDL